MEAFGPLQPREWIAILATALDLGLTVYGVWSGKAREAGAAAFAFKGKRAAVAVVVLGIGLHLLIRYRLSNPDAWGPRMQADVWTIVAAIRGLVAAWNLVVLSKARRG